MTQTNTNDPTRTNAKRPPSVSLEAVSWSVSARVWVWTILLTAVTVALVGVVGWVRYDAPAAATAIACASSPKALLAAFLGARAVAFVHCQGRRDRAMAAGRTALNSDVSLASVVTVASYTVIGLIATGVAMPILHEVSGSFLYLAAGIAVVATPIGYLLLFYQLHELIAADRYRRGFRVFPAAWFYAASLPWVALAWLLLTGQSTVLLPIPEAARESTSLLWASSLRVDAWGLAFAGICAPTLLAYLYVVRRQVEAFVRSLLGI